MIHVQKKISRGLNDIEHYINVDFVFKSNKFVTTMLQLNDSDQEKFYYLRDVSVFSTVNIFNLKLNLLCLSETFFYNFSSI